MPADELQGLLSEIDAEADLEAFTQIAASSIHRWAGRHAVWGYAAKHNAHQHRVLLACMLRRCRLPATNTRAFVCSHACSAEALSVRQREAVDQICSELLGSAEIVR